MTEPGDACEFGRRRLGCVRRQQREHDEPIGIGAIEVGRPVVVRPQARGPHLEIGDRQRKRRAIDNVGVDAVAVHVCEPLTRGAGPETGVVLSDQALRATATRAEKRTIE